MLTLGVVREALTGKAATGEDQPIANVVTDSRQCTPGSLFVALPGERNDGHDFVGEAFQQGAAAALVQREIGGDFRTQDLRRGETRDWETQLGVPVCLRVENTLAALQTLARYWRSRLNVLVIGITGSVGKTTTKELAAAVLSTRYRTLKTEGNLNNEIGVPLTLLRLDETHERAVLEMGFYVPGEIALLCQLARPSVGVITNVGVSHLGQAGTIEAIAAGKAELVEALPPEGAAILNHDDERVRPMARLTRARVFTYGLDPGAQLWADEIEGLGLEGIRFRTHYRGEALNVRVPLLGRHSVHNALRAMAVGLVEGLSWQEIVEGLSSRPTQLRLVAVGGPRSSVLLDDTYNASPESVIAALNLLHELEGRRVAVLGDMLELGSFEEQGHRMVGVRAGEVVHELVTLGERSRWIAEAARESGLAPEQVVEMQDAEEVIALLRQRIRSGDIVLIKGSRGMHMDRIVAALEERRS